MDWAVAWRAVGPQTGTGRHVGAAPVTTRFSGPLAWGTWALCLGLTMLALVLDPTQAADELAFLAFPTVGALVASRRPENPIGWLFCALGLPLGVERIAKAYATYALI